MQKQKLLTGSLTILVVAIMVGTAELLREKEIIFPEITALAIGMIFAPRLCWRTNRIRTFLLITLCSVEGVLIVRYLPLPIWLQIMIAFSSCQLIYLFSGTTFAPMISAAVLPVLLRTESWIYPIAAICLTALILFLQKILEGAGMKHPKSFSPTAPPSIQDGKDAVLRILCVSILSIPALITGWQFCTAPPLLVAFTEFSRNGCKARSLPVQTICLMTACALAGTVSRWGFSILLPLPLTFSAVTATAIMLILLSRFEFYLPPSGAITILPMILPAESILLYPIQIFLGVSIFLLVSRFAFREKSSAAKPENPNLLSQSELSSEK